MISRIRPLDRERALRLSLKIPFASIFASERCELLQSHWSLRWLFTDPDLNKEALPGHLPVKTDVSGCHKLQDYCDTAFGELGGAILLQRSREHRHCPLQSTEDVSMTRRWLSPHSLRSPCTMVASPQPPKVRDSDRCQGFSTPITR